MKRKLKAALSLVLTALLVLSLNGCKHLDKSVQSYKSTSSQPRETSALVGEWTAVYDITKILQSKSLFETDLKIELENRNVKFNMNLKSDGTYILTADEKAVKKALTEYRNGPFKKLMQENLSAEAEKSGKTVSELLKESDTTVDELVKEYMSDEIINEMIEDIKTDGRWKQEGSRLYITDDVEYEFDEDGYFEIKYNKNELTLLKLADIYGDEETAEVNKNLFPIIFKRN